VALCHSTRSQLASSGRTAPSSGTKPPFLTVPGERYSAVLCTASLRCLLASVEPCRRAQPSPHSTHPHRRHGHDLQGGAAGLAQGRQELKGSPRAQQPDGTYCIRLWQAPHQLSSGLQLTRNPEHMREMLENVRKSTFSNYRQILQDIHEKPSIIAQTHKTPSAGDGRPVVSLRPLYLCLQCPSIMTEADRDIHIQSKSHCFCGFFHALWTVRS
jgi:hypothetical protein